MTLRLETPSAIPGDLRFTESALYNFASSECSNGASTTITTVDPNNPFSGIISAGHKTLFNNMINALLENTALTIPCQLLFADAQTEECPNCIFDSVSQRSSNIYKDGGPIPFTNGNCPYCFGVGTLATDNTETLYMAVLWNYKDWIGWNGQIPDNTIMPYGYAQTLTKISTLTSIKSAKEALFATDLSAYVVHKFTRDSEPNPIGFGGSNFLTTMWKRIG